MNITFHDLFGKKTGWKNFIHLLLINLTKVFVAKSRLNSSSIVIDPCYSLLLSDTSQYEFTIIKKSLDEIHRDDWANIVAYIGHINVNQLQYFSEKLRWLQIPSHGYNGFDQKALYKNPQIVVTNVKDIFSEPIAQYCITAYYVFNTYSFRPKKGFSLSSCQIIDDVTVVIIGIGNIGMTLARKCSKLGWSVYGVKRSITKNIPDCVKGVYTLNQIDEILPHADYVVNLLPESSNSIGLYNYEFFQKMKPTALFCNVGRKSAVIDKDLESAVDNGVIRGAILDAHNDYNYRNPNVILTGHSSSVSPDNTAKFNKFFGSQLKKFLSGEDLQCEITLR